MRVGVKNGLTTGASSEAATLCSNKGTATTLDTSVVWSALSTEVVTVGELHRMLVRPDSAGHALQDVMPDAGSCIHPPGRVRHVMLLFLVGLLFADNPGQPSQPTVEYVHGANALTAKFTAPATTRSYTYKVIAPWDCPLRRLVG